jgi:hypothetical protein
VTQKSICPIKKLSWVKLSNILLWKSYIVCLCLIYHHIIHSFVHSFKQYLLDTNNAPDANHNELDICPPRTIMHINFYRIFFKGAHLKHLFIFFLKHKIEGASIVILPSQEGLPRGDNIWARFWCQVVFSIVKTFVQWQILFQGKMCEGLDLENVCCAWGTNRTRHWS